MGQNGGRPTSPGSIARKISRLVFTACAFIPATIGAAVLRLLGVDAQSGASAFRGNAPGEMTRVMLQYKWPEIYQTKRGYLLKASHESPRREAWPGRLCVPTAIAGSFVIALFIPVAGYIEAAKIIGGGFLVGWASYRFFWPRACFVQLRIRVEDGGATWHEPGGKRVVVEAEEPCEVTVSVPHRLAGEQARINTIIQQNQRNAASPAPLPVKYLAASEVIVSKGDDLQFTYTLADLAFDAVGDRARVLRAALERVILANRKEVADAKLRQRGWSGSDRR